MSPPDWIEPSWYRTPPILVPPIRLAAMEFARRCRPPMDPDEALRGVDSIYATHRRRHPVNDHDEAEAEDAAVAG